MKCKKVMFLGAGSYGRVHLARSVSESDNPAPSCFAVKSAYVSSSKSLIKEKTLLDQLVGCPYTIQCFGHDASIEKGRETYNIMLEYAPGGTLKEFMDFNGGRFQERDVACFTAMLVHGLTVVHHKGIVHCDLKPNNILVFPMEKEYGVVNHVLKIADFGLAKTVWEEDQIYPHGWRGGLNRGALLYASPEAVTLGVHEPPHDVWSLGCIVVEMLTGQPLWRRDCTRNEMVRRVGFETPQIPESVSQIGRDFLTKCLERDASKRWTMQKLLSHPWVMNSFIHRFRGIEDLLYQRNPFGYNNSLGNWRTHTFSDTVGIIPYPGKQDVSQGMMIKVAADETNGRA